MELSDKPPVIDLPLHEPSEADQKNSSEVSRSNSFTDNINQVTLLTRKASNLLDQQEKTEIEIADLLLKQGFSQADINRVKAEGVRDIHHAIDFLTEDRLDNVILQGTIECLICQAEVSQDRTSLLECMHAFCETCFSEYLALKVNEAQVLSIRCPQHRCQTILPEEVVLLHLPDQLHDKYKRFSAKAMINKDPHIRWCPRPNCEGYSKGSSSHTHLTCRVCLLEYCYYCSEAWHGDAPCKDQADQLLDAWARENNIRYCPNCRFRVEKMMGCSHMACIQCNYEWCWLCGEPWSAGHFAACSEFKRWWQDPPVLGIVLFLLGPFSLVFLSLFVCCIIALNERDPAISSFTRNRCLTLTVAFFLSLLFSPILILFCLISVPIALATETCKCCRCGSLMRVAAVSLVIPYFVVVLLGLCLAGVLLTLTGLVMVVTKTYLTLRKYCVARVEPSNNYNAMW